MDSPRNKQFQRGMYKLLIHKHGFKRRDAQLFVKLFIEEIAQALERGEEVDLGRMGKLYLVKIPEQNFVAPDPNDPPLHRPKQFFRPSYYKIYYGWPKSYYRGIQERMESLGNPMPELHPKTAAKLRRKQGTTD